LKNGHTKFVFSTLCDQFKFYVAFADVMMIFPNFWTQNDKFLLEMLH